MKKINSKKKVKKYNFSKPNSILENGTDGVEDSSKISNISSSYGSLSTFTSSSPSLTSSSSSHTDQSSGSLNSCHENETKVTNQKQYGVVYKMRKACYGSYISMSMFFISLLVLIMWGKFFAIFYTIIWFYAMPPRATRPCNESDLSKENQFGSI
ncbi:hypothetical protein Lalb_Chr20g0110031 [Lupinus albus]|uniref:Transmembrane protein n=1 Tax=Lupinus albus TaxID=3870 RepID=A0A6A4NP16_LUPAL|nr:hypothetical protein Lalb_Chr20g0110031 [Lupinus albus]